MVVSRGFHGDLIWVWRWNSDVPIEWNAFLLGIEILFKAKKTCFGENTLIFLQWQVCTVHGKKNVFLMNGLDFAWWKGWILPMKRWETIMNICKVCVCVSDHKLGIVFWNTGKFTDILNCLYHNPPSFCWLIARHYYHPLVLNSTLFFGRFFGGAPSGPPGCKLVYNPR